MEPLFFPEATLPASVPRAVVLRAITFSTAASIAAHLGERTTGSGIVRFSIDRTLTLSEGEVKADALAVDLLDMNIRYAYSILESTPLVPIPRHP